MRIRTITPHDLGNLLTQQPDLPLVDVRTPAEFHEAHVVGAGNLPLDLLTAERLRSTLGERQNETVYFICKVGIRSHMACERAYAFGLTDVVNVEGGTDDCITVGLPIESDRRAVTLKR